MAMAIRQWFRNMSAIGVKKRRPLERARCLFERLEPREMLSGSNAIDGLGSASAASGSAAGGADAAGSLATQASQTFVHPGGLLTQADLDRIKTKVAAGEHPWID